MTNGSKRGQLFRSSLSSFPCLNPTFAFIMSAILFCFIGYNHWSQSHRIKSCRGEIVRLHDVSKTEMKNRIEMQGRLTELHLLLEKQTKLFARMNKVNSNSEEKAEDKDKKILKLENEVMQLRERVERCNLLGPRLSQSRLDESESNSRPLTSIRNKTFCDQEMIRQFDEIDKWIKSMVDDRTYSQFQQKFSRDGEKTEADKLQKLEKVVMQRDEIKAVKDEKIKEEIRARETKKSNENKLKAADAQPRKLVSVESVEEPNADSDGKKDSKNV